MDNQYESLSKAELIERLRLAEKSRRTLSRLAILLVIAAYVYIFKDELVSMLVQLGAEVKSDG